MFRCRDDIRKHLSVFTVLFLGTCRGQRANGPQIAPPEVSLDASQVHENTTRMLTPEAPR